MRAPAHPETDTEIEWFVDMRISPSSVCLEGLEAATPQNRGAHLALRSGFQNTILQIKGTRTLREMG